MAKKKINTKVICGVCEKPMPIDEKAPERPWPQHLKKCPDCGGDFKIVYKGDGK